jgi:cob(I)alamin adenosyltransferase
MGNRIAYTARGDDGSTCLIGKGRFSKADTRFEVLGTLDEASAVIGLAKAMLEDQDIKDVLTHVQRDLYHMMGEISVAPETEVSLPGLSADAIKWMEAVIEKYAAESEYPGGFIIPGDTREDAMIDVARAIVRRAERRLVELIETEGMNNPNPNTRHYLNRLSSLLFTLELVIHNRLGVFPPTMAKDS